MSASPQCTSNGKCEEARTYDTTPYPGARPTGSWLLTASRHVHRVDGSENDWIDATTGQPVDLSSRHFVLGYGSNLNPSKLTDNLTGIVVVLAATIHDWAAVWCKARRGTDDAVVATIVEWPGAVEHHGVLCVTDDQLEQMDIWEGHHTGYYRRETFEGRCELSDGSHPPLVKVYVGTSHRRPPLVREGRLLRCGPSGVAYDIVDGLVS